MSAAWKTAMREYIMKRVQHEENAKKVQYKMNATWKNAMWKVRSVRKSRSEEGQHEKS